LAYPEHVNTTDETEEPVRGLRVTLDSDLPFDNFFGADLIRRGPPTYEWFFGDLAEEDKYTGWATGVIIGFHSLDSPGAVPVTFSPGYDLSRSFDKTVFTEPDTQTVTVTVIPREEMIKGVQIFVHAGLESDLVDAVIISHSGWDGEQANVTPDGQYSEVGAPGLGIPVEINTPVTITVTFQVTPKVPKVEYKPPVGIGLTYSSEYYSGTTSGTTLGDSFSYTNEAGTWTVSAEGNYVWDWAAGSSPGYSASLLPLSKIPPTLSSTRDQAVTWQVIIGIGARVVIAGSVTFFFIRRRRGRATQ
jgi:hypothetical protein